jgi:SAM-dependent methyltransferase
MTKEADYYQIHHVRLSFLLNKITALGLKKKSKILDIGCYPLFLFNKLKDVGFQVFGITSDFAPINTPTVKIMNIDTDQLPYPDNTFDLVIFSEIIEHLVGDPQNYLSDIYRVLKPNGYFLLTTPNVLRSQNIFNLIFCRNIYFPIFQLSQNIYNRHNREYTLAEIINLTRASKLKIINSSHFISYTPNRQKNSQDRFLLKLIKYLNYFFMLIFKSRSDTIYLLAQK